MRIKTYSPFLQVFYYQSFAQRHGKYNPDKWLRFTQKSLPFIKNFSIINYNIAITSKKDLIANRLLVFYSELNYLAQPFVQN